ncbi:MAG TPA: Na/Pi symporter [Burkholderiales bacterium]|nr:Na/Pi symporter [Burkholderiales bacterium]
MEILSRIGEFIGGLGLFLLGMWMMTEGLKLAAGHALERILGAWTRTRWHGLASGLLVTSAVQSSSAVTVATIGFVNAGLLTLTQAIWVVFGANVGTSTTGWLVALVGFKLNIGALALPVIGIGALLKLTGEGRRRAAVGLAIAGFGVLFLGIELLKNAFADIGTQFDPHSFAIGGIGGTLAYALIGLLLTVLMQSSSAALVVILTAAGGGLVSLSAGAALIIGANIGTTITAVIAVIGATPNAKRTAAAHVLFKALTGTITFLLLPVLLWMIVASGHAFGIEMSPVTALAVFHTVFNLIGVAVMWPLSDRLVRLLSGRFRTAEEDEARPRHLDDNVLAVPALALDALGLEVRRLGSLAIAAARNSVGGAAYGLDRQRGAADKLMEAIAGFAAKLNEASLPEESASALPEYLRIGRYYDVVATLSAELAAVPSASIYDIDVSNDLKQLEGAADRVLSACDSAAPEFSLDEVERLFDAFERHYQEHKESLLRAGVQGRLSVSQMDLLLQKTSLIRRAIDQSVKAARRLTRLPRLVSPERKETTTAKAATN